MRIDVLWPADRPREKLLERATAALGVNDYNRCCLQPGEQASQGPLESRWDVVERGEIVWGEDLSLNDGEEDLDLIEPADMGWSMNEYGIGPLLPEALDRNLPAMNGSVIDDPENALRSAIGLLAHDLPDEVVEGALVTSVVLQLRGCPAHVGGHQCCYRRPLPGRPHLPRSGGARAASRPPCRG